MKQVSGNWQPSPKLEQKGLGSCWIHGAMELLDDFM